MSRVVGAYVCPAGVFGVEGRRRSKGFEVVRTFSAPAQLDSPEAAAGALTRALDDAGIRHAEIAVAVRGFDVVHHVLSLPPAPDALLAPIVERELRRLEPAVADPVVAWTRLSPEPVAPGEPLPQPQILAAAMSREVSDTLVDGVRRGGHAIAHLTAASVALHRVAGEFLSPTEPTVLVAELSDGPYLGFSLAGAVRLVVEPPVPRGDPLPDAAALAEEAELGAVFVRQQFRGAQVSRAAVATAGGGHGELESALGARLGVVVSRLPIGDLSGDAITAFGATLDAEQTRPVSLGGKTERRAEESAPGLRLAAAVVLFLAALAGAWTGVQALRARESAAALLSARRQIDHESFGFASLRETAARRKLIRDAASVIQLAARDRERLQRALASLASSVSSTINVDSIVFERSGETWRASLGGTVAGRTSGQAVQALNDFYRELPRRAQVESLSLRQLEYADTTGGSSVHFQVAFRLPGRQKP